MLAFPCRVIYFVCLLILLGIAGGEDDRFEEEKEMLIKEIDGVSRLPNLNS